MPEIQYPTNPNSDTAFVVQEDGTKNRALMTAPQDTSTLELPSNANSTKGYVTIDGKKQRVILTADISGGGGATYTAGTGISIDANNEISVTSPVLVNNVSTTSLAIGDGAIADDAYTKSNNVAVGANSSAGTDNFASETVAVGSSAKATAIGNIAVGAFSGGALGAYNTVVGTYACFDTSAVGSIIIGGNARRQSAAKITESGTLNINLSQRVNYSYVTNTYKLLDFDGTVPADRLASTTGLADGNYRLRLVMANGVPTLEWVAE